MDIFGAVAAAIALAIQIKTMVEQIGQNESDCASLTADVVESLTKIEDYLKQDSSLPSDALLNDISEFENALTTILHDLEGLIKRKEDTLWGKSKAKFKELSDTGDIKNKLVELRQKVQQCSRNLQLSCTIRIDSGVSTMNQQISALRQDQQESDRKIQMLLDAMIPGSNPIRRAALDRIEENIETHITTIDTDGTLGQELVRIHTMNESQVAASIRSVRRSSKSLSASTVERHYLKEKIKDLTSSLPKIQEQLPTALIVPKRSSYKGRISWKSYNTSGRSREDSIRETLRILMFLRSGETISFVEAAQDLLSLSQALGDLGMQKEADEIRDWAVQICGELGGIWDKSIPEHEYEPEPNGRLRRLFTNLGGSRRPPDAQKGLSQAVVIRPRQIEREQLSDLVKLSESLEKSCEYLVKMERFEAAAKEIEGVIGIKRCISKADPKFSMSSLGRSVASLALAFDRLERTEDAVKEGEEVVKIYRPLAEHDPIFFQSNLAESSRTLASYLKKAGRITDAIQSGKEAVKIYQELVQSGRWAYQRMLVHSLCELASYMDDLGQYEDAIKAEQEAVDICRILVKDEKSTYTDILAKALPRLAVYQGKNGLYEAAAERMEGAIEILQDLVLFQPNLRPLLPECRQRLKMYLEKVAETTARIE